LSMYYRKRSEFGLRRSFFAADGPSSSIIVLNQKLEGAVPPPAPAPSCLLSCSADSPSPTVLYSVSPIVFDTTVGDFWQRVTMCVTWCRQYEGRHLTRCTCLCRRKLLTLRWLQQ
jgi:hypothetical protein